MKKIVFRSGRVNFAMLENSNKRIPARKKNANRRELAKDIKRVEGLDKVKIQAEYVTSAARKGRYDFHNFMPSVFFLSSQIFGKDCELKCLDFIRTKQAIPASKCELKLFQIDDFKIDTGTFCYEVDVPDFVFNIWDIRMKNKILRNTVSEVLINQSFHRIERHLIDSTNRHLYEYEIAIEVFGDVKISQTKLILKKLIDKLSIEKVIYDDFMVSRLTIIKREKEEKNATKFKVYAKEVKL